MFTRNSRSATPIQDYYAEQEKSAQYAENKTKQEDVARAIAARNALVKPTNSNIKKPFFIDDPKAVQAIRSGQNTGIIGLDRIFRNQLAEYDTQTMQYQKDLEEYNKKMAEPIPTMPQDPEALQPEPIEPNKNSTLDKFLRTRAFRR